MNHWNDATVLAALVAAAGVTVGGILALVTALIVNRITKRLKERELFQTAMQHLTGRTQNRSVGIALLKSYAAETGQKEVVATIFLAQMLHLFDSGYGGGNNTYIKTIQAPETTDLRKIEQFNFAVMKDAVEDWGLLAVGEKATAITQPLTISPDG